MRIDEIDEIIMAWDDWVDMKNLYQFGMEIIDMKDFQSLLKKHSNGRGR